MKTVEFKIDPRSLFGPAKGPVKQPVKQPDAEFIMEFPESFDPKIGDRIHIDYPKDGKWPSDVVTLDMYVCSVGWRVIVKHSMDGRTHDRIAIMRVEVASEMPAQPTTRRVHNNSKK